MKKLLIVLIVISFVSCNDNNKKKTETPITTSDTSLLPIIDTTIIEEGEAPIADNVMAKKDKADKEKKEKISCAWGNWKFNGTEKFNYKKRNLEEGKRAKPPRGNHGHGTDTVVVQPPPPQPPPPTSSKKVVLLNFFGARVSGTMWNTSGDLNLGDAGLTQQQVDDITAQVQLHYPEYDIQITTDRAVFDSAAWGSKIEVIITEDYGWYGQAGGVAYIGSFFWTDHSPAFVFSLLLNYSVHNIEEAIAHEIGHTLRLRHQSDCVNGVNTNEYSLGKTMGNSYGRFPIGLWVVGTNSFCAEQNDMNILQSSLGLK